MYIGNKNADNCYVELHFIDNLGIKHTLKRLKNKYNNSKNFLMLDDRHISQEDLVCYYSDKKLFLSIINSNYFISRSPTEQKSILNKYLPNIDINSIYNALDSEDKKVLEGSPTNVTDYIKELNSNKKMYEDKIKLLQGKIDYANVIVTEPMENLKTFDKQEELTLAQQELSFIKSDKQLENKQKQEKIVENLESQIQVHKTQIENLNLQLSEGKKNYLAIKNEPVSCCPMCNQELSTKGKLLTISKMKLNLETQYADKQKLEEELQKLSSKLVTEKCNLYALSSTDNFDKNERISQIEQDIKLLEQEKSEIAKHNASVTSKKENIEKARLDIINFQDTIQSLYKNIDDLKKAKDIAQKLLINYIEAKMQCATQHFKDVSIKYYSVLKDSGEIREDFIITYKGNEFKNLSRSETIATSLEISNMLNKISGVNLPLFVDDSESCADYNFIEDFSNDTQIFIAKVEKGQDLKISDYQDGKTMLIAA